MRIAVYTIALNEERFVTQWFESAKEADYLLIADTGSSDKTVTTAKKLGINVQQIFVNPWRFDNARNAALALLPPDIDYCIALAMDEDLQYGGDKIHKRFGYRWKHPVHEVITADRIEETQGWTGLEIHHHPDNTKSRGQYMPLLELAVREDPMDDRNAYYYARELFFHGKFPDAKKEFVRHLSLPRATWKPERAASMRYIAKCSVGEEREQWFLKAVAEAPDRREAAVDLAEYYYQEQRWQECFDIVKSILEIKEKPLEYLCEEKAWGSFPYDIGSIAAFSLQEFEIAKNWGEEAIKLSPSDDRLKRNMIFFTNSLNK
jgi:hypothetical protein